MHPGGSGTGSLSGSRSGGRPLWRLLWSLSRSLRSSKTRVSIISSCQGMEIRIVYGIRYTDYTVKNQVYDHPYLPGDGDAASVEARVEAVVLEMVRFHFGSYPEMIGSLELGNVWLFVQLIHRHTRPKNPKHCLT